MLLALTLISLVALGLAFVFARASVFHLQRKGQIPVSVNYFFTRQCNKSCKSCNRRLNSPFLPSCHEHGQGTDVCNNGWHSTYNPMWRDRKFTNLTYKGGFCFHTAKTSHMEDISRAKRGLQLLQRAGMKKINFAGGEPFLYPKFLGELVDYCKEDLHLESVSIITNGSLVREEWVRQHAKNLDILACSCDSFDEDTNIKIGRGTGNQVEILYRIAEWCRESEIKFKLNTVVTRLNYEEDMNEHINILNPFRWKVFQVLIVEGEVN